MDSSRRTRHGLLAVALYVLGTAALLYLALQIALDRHLFATALLLVGVAALIGTKAVRLLQGLVHSTSSVAARSAEALSPSDVPTRLAALLGRPMPSGERVASFMSEGALTDSQELDYRQSLLDTVSTALLVVDDDGRVSLANRAARQLAAVDVYRLEQIAAIGPTVARLLLATPVGSRQIVRLTDGRAVLAAVSRFVAPRRAPRRLISVQPISGELDAVEVKAWQDMVHVLAHEMMNSLTPIASLSESLEQMLAAGEEGELDAQPEGSNAELSGALEAIKRRSRGLMEFVERYRQFAELPAPRMESLRIADFLSGIERLMAGTLRERHIAFHCEVAPEDLTCVADHRLLEQAVINLLRNAIDAVGGSDVPAIELLGCLQDGQVVLTVADNGEGLPAGLPEQVFVPFFSTKSGGTGIGLSIARQIALAHGGRLDVGANQPGGAVFSLTVPAAGHASDLKLYTKGDASRQDCAPTSSEPT